MTLTANAAAQRDPTRTVSLRRAYANDARRRFDALKAEIRQTVANGLLGDDGYLDTGLVSAFIAWLRDAIQRLVLSGGWQEPYARSGFMRGVGFADRAVREADLAVRPVEVLGIFLYQAEVEAIYQEAVADLANIGQALVEEIEAGLLASLAASNAELEALVMGRVDKIGLTRARTLAATSVVGAVAAGTLSRLASYGIDRVGPVVELTTALKPCPICQGLAVADNGQGPGVYTIEQARGGDPGPPKLQMCLAAPGAAAESKLKKSSSEVLD